MTTVTDALRQRMSTREFLPTPLDEALVREILEVARWAPSGGNLQPWKLIVVSGSERAAVTAIGRTISPDGANSEEGDTPIYPPKLWEPYRSRRFRIGELMYAQLGIGREDRAGRLARLQRNFEFFGAPVGVFFVIDRGLGRPQWAHLGMFMLAVALAAHERGVASCFQEFWSMARAKLHHHFRLPPSDLLYCGMALGYADPHHAVNQLRSERAPLDEFASLRGFC
ncbi:MAG: nitroreductase [Gammaproteobacteria bacterium]|nr:nitroreductase [Gammaproteobacteria bacterium]